MINELELTYITPSTNSPTTYRMDENLFIYGGFNHFAQPEKVHILILPNHLAYIPYAFFNNFLNLTSIEISPSNSHYKTIDGVLFSKDGSTLLAYPKNKSASFYDIPLGTETIAPNAFQNNTQLYGVNFPYTVTTIGERAFEGCTGLQSISLPPGLTSLGEEAFYNCEGLKKVLLPQNTTTLTEKAFGLFFVDEDYDWQLFISREENVHQKLSIWLPPSITTIENSFHGRKGEELHLVVEENSYSHKYAVESRLPFAFTTSPTQLVE